VSAGRPICSEPAAAISVTVPALPVAFAPEASEESVDPPLNCRESPPAVSAPLAMILMFPALAVPVVAAKILVLLMATCEPVISISPPICGPLVDAFSVLLVTDSGPLPALSVIVAGAAAERLDAVPPAVVLRLALPSAMPEAAMMSTEPAAPALAPADEEITDWPVSDGNPICAEPANAARVTVPALDAPFTPLLVSEETVDPFAICRAAVPCESAPVAVMLMSPALPVV
jgi:hypothetical protein